MMFRLIIFDFDGPILDSYEIARDSLLIAAKNLKIPEPDEETLILHWGYPGRMVCKRIFPELTDKKLELSVQVWAKKEKSEKIPLINGAIETLEKIKKQGFKTCLLTSRSHNLDFHLKDIDLENLFDFVQSWDNPDFKEQKPCHKNHIFLSSFKPNPEVFDEVFKWTNKNGVSKDQILMIDDALVGLQAARTVGIAFLGVCTGPLNSKEKWQKYGNLDRKYVINTIAELPAWLENNMRV